MYHYIYIYIYTYSNLEYEFMKVTTHLKQTIKHTHYSNESTNKTKNYINQHTVYVA